MTSHQIQLVQESFEKVRPIGQLAGELFYKNLFEIAPELKLDKEITSMIKYYAD